MDFKTIKDKIDKIIKDDYLKQYFKISKMFQILVTGYNASCYKTFQVFSQHGWKVTPGFSYYNNGSMDLMFECYEPTMKMSVEFYMTKNLKTGVLIEDPLMERGYIDINVDRFDKLFEPIKQLTSITYLESFIYNDREKLIYNIITKEDGGYILQFSYS